MKVELWQVGKTSFDYLKSGTDLYEKRIKNYLPFEVVTIPDIKNAKNLSVDLLKEKEGKEILKKLQPGDFLILLDEKGKSFGSVRFSAQLEKWLQLSNKRLVFLIGGAYGVSKDIFSRAQIKLSLSEMTFSHQMVRLFLIEQLYRALTIMRNEPYHHR
ncbi:MAG: 23S rRNA (pseudouridine(1915)-N(3))-methyltransferase RlmH [Bacteroidota bacterium]